MFEWTVFLMEFYQTEDSSSAVRDIIHIFLNLVMKRFFELDLTAVNGKTAEGQPVWKAMQFLIHQWKRPESALAQYIAKYDPKHASKTSAVMYFNKRKHEKPGAPRVQ